MARINENTDLATVLEVLEASDAFRGKRFCITGHLGRPRKEFVKIIEQLGGFFEKTPVWGVNYLITNKDWNTNAVKGGKSIKLKKAEQMGIKIITEAEFFEMAISKATTCGDLFG